MSRCFNTSSSLTLRPQFCGSRLSSPAPRSQRSFRAVTFKHRFPTHSVINMREKLKAVLHRRKRSTPTQSPRASYEQSDYGSPHAEQIPYSPRQRDRRRSSASQNTSPRTNHVQNSNAAHKNAIIGHSAAAPLESMHNSPSNDTNSSRSVAEDNRTHASTLAHSGDLAVESSDTSLSTSSHDTGRLNSLQPTSRMLYEM